MAFIFDLDGTLINSTEIYKIIQKELYEKFNLNPSKEKEAEVEEIVFKILHGENRKNLEVKLMWVIYKKLGLSFIQRIKALIMAGKIYKKEKEKIKLYDGVEDLFEFLDKNSFKYAIATTSSEREVDDRLVKFPDFYKKLKGKIVSRSSVKKMKPAPDSLYLACELMGGINPENTVMIGDMNTDIMMGKAVGAVTIAVLTGIFTKERFLELEPDFILESVADIPKLFDQIKEKIEKN